MNSAHRGYEHGVPVQENEACVVGYWNSDRTRRCRSHERAGHGERVDVVAANSGGDSDRVWREPSG